MFCEFCNTIVCTEVLEPQCDSRKSEFELYFDLKMFGFVAAGIKMRESRDGSLIYSQW